MRIGAALISGALVAAIATSTSNARAARSARLVYVRGSDAEACPDEEAVRTAVAGRLGYDPFVAVASTILTARVHREGGGFRTEVALVDENGVERGARQMTIQSPECVDAISAMALTISIAIDPLSITGPSHPPSQEKRRESREDDAPVEHPTGATLAVTKTRTASPVETTSDKSESRSVRWFAGVAMVGSAGMGPSLALGGAGFLGGRWRSFSLAAEGRIDLPSSKASSQGGRVASQVLLGELVPCAHLAITYACGVFAMGELHATGVDLTTSRTPSALYTGAGVRIGVGIPISAAVELRSHAEGLASFNRRILTINAADAYVFPWISADLELAIAVRF